LLRATTAGERAEREQSDQGLTRTERFSHGILRAASVRRFHGAEQVTECYAEPSRRGDGAS